MPSGASRCDTWRGAVSRSSFLIGQVLEPKEEGFVVGASLSVHDGAAGLRVALGNASRWLPQCELSEAQVPSQHCTRE